MPDKASMPSFDKPPPELVARFDVVMAGYPAASRRQMFGYPCVFVNGQMATGLHRDRWFVRLPEPERAELMAMDGAGPFEVMPGRAMGNYVVFPPDMVNEPGALDRWLELSLGYTASLPPKR